MTAQLKDWTHGASEVELDSAGDLRRTLKKLDEAFPGIGQRIMDDQDRLRANVNVFVNGENSRYLREDETKLKDGDEVVILPSVAGG